MKLKTHSGKQIDDLLLNARVVSKCRFDLDGRIDE